MGDRICIRFVDGDNRKSAVLYAHWAGRRLLDNVQTFLDDVHATIGSKMKVRGPLDRLEADNVMFNFIWWLTKDNDDFTRGSWRLCADFNDCDTSDNGPWEINTRTGTMERF